MLRNSKQFVEPMVSPSGQSSNRSQSRLGSKDLEYLKEGRRFGRRGSATDQGTSVVALLRKQGLKVEQQQYGQRLRP